MRHISEESISQALRDKVITDLEAKKLEEVFLCNRKNKAERFSTPQRSVKPSK